MSYLVQKRLLSMFKIKSIVINIGTWQHFKIYYSIIKEKSWLENRKDVVISLSRRKIGFIIEKPILEVFFAHKNNVMKKLESILILDWSVVVECK